MQPTQLYLDTARLGRMTSRAQQAHADFCRLAGDEGGSLFLERFLRCGSQDWSNALRSRYPGVCLWQGVTELKASLRHLAGCSPDLPVLLANRSAVLMKLAARLLFHPCRNVLVTDLDWPPYRDILHAEACRAGRSLTEVALKEALLAGRLGEEELVALIRRRLIQQGCDGLFLTAVSHLGIRLPVERIVRVAEQAHTLRFVVADGAQDFCHVSADLRNEYCDLYLTGCHKWLSAFHPLGLGFYGRRRSASMIETILSQGLSSGEIDDPLLRFCLQLENGDLDGRTETVNLASLFSCQGAVADAVQVTGQSASSLGIRLCNLQKAASLAPVCGWLPVLPVTSLQSGILLLQAERPPVRQLSAEPIRRAFADRGVALTAYEGGLVRLSLPDRFWSGDELCLLGESLRASA